MGHGVYRFPCAVCTWCLLWMCWWVGVGVRVGFTLDLRRRGWGVHQCQMPTAQYFVAPAGQCEARSSRGVFHRLMFFSKCRSCAADDINLHVSALRPSLAMSFAAIATRRCCPVYLTHMWRSISFLWSPSTPLVPGQYVLIQFTPTIHHETNRRNVDEM